MLLRRYHRPPKQEPEVEVPKTAVEKPEEIPTPVEVAAEMKVELPKKQKKVAE